VGRCLTSEVPLYVECMMRHHPPPRTTTRRTNSASMPFGVQGPEGSRCLGRHPCTRYPAWSTPHPAWSKARMGHISLFPLGPCRVIGGGVAATLPRRTMLGPYCRGTSLVKTRTPLGPYRRPMPMGQVLLGVLVPPRSRYKHVLVPFPLKGRRGCRDYSKIRALVAPRGGC